MKEKISKIVTNSLTTLNILLENKIPIMQGDSCALYGGPGALDSLGLVSLIVSVEEEIEREFNINLTLANDKAMSQRNSPFLTVGTFVNYVESLLNQELLYV
ncbi:MAG: acyl carrier protein [Gammaproteobacteria bacterium]|nr:acyl carrier protein [Gammaproteobacteria bacterium]